MIKSRLLERLRRNAVAIVDSWDFDDKELHSVSIEIYISLRLLWFVRFLENVTAMSTRHC